MCGYGSDGDVNEPVVKVLKDDETGEIVAAGHGGGGVVEGEVDELAQQPEDESQSLLLGVHVVRQTQHLQRHRDAETRRRRDKNGIP